MSKKHSSITPTDSKNNEEFQGRLGAIKDLMSKGKFSLSIGSKETRFADINIDIDPSVSPDVVADARFLPFKEGIFQRVLFTDVIEHIPKNYETKALQEIYRVTRNGGRLIITTPNDISLYTLLDPARYIMTHRHYRKEYIKDLLESQGFKVEMIFTAGGLWAFLNNLWYCCITYPLKKIFGCSLPYAPSFMQRKENDEYKHTRLNGYTIFTRAKKEALT